jgi:hypothetical protein
MLLLQKEKIIGHVIPILVISDIIREVLHLAKFIFLANQSL